MNLVHKIWITSQWCPLVLELKTCRSIEVRVLRQDPILSFFYLRICAIKPRQFIHKTQSPKLNCYQWNSALLFVVIKTYRKAGLIVNKIKFWRKKLKRKSDGETFYVYKIAKPFSKCKTKSFLNFPHLILWI